MLFYSRFKDEEDTSLEEKNEKWNENDEEKIDDDKQTDEEEPEEELA